MRNSDVSGFEVPDRDVIFGWIKDMYGLGPRRPGTEADHRCEDYLAGRLEEMGFSDVKKDPIPIRVWEAREFKLEVAARGAGFEQVESHFIPYTTFTPESGVEAEMVYVSPKQPQGRALKNVRGKIVVTDIEYPQLDTKMLEKLSFFVHDPTGDVREVSHKAVWVRLNWWIYEQAAAQGAAGFIGILKDHYRDGQRQYAPYGFKEDDILDKSLPGFWVDRFRGEQLREQAKRGGSRARLLLRGRLEQGVTHNVSGIIPGETDETYLVGCHHDAPFDSAVEDASGCSIALATAHHFSKTRELRRTLMVNFSAGHFYGSIGTRALIKRNRGGLLDRMALEFHVEHIARQAIEGPDGDLVVLDSPEPMGGFVTLNRYIRRAIEKAVVEQGMAPTVLLPPEGPLGAFPPTDGGDYHLEGVPLINFIGCPIYLLNAEDTLDKVATEYLQPTARAVVSVLRDIDGVPLQRLRRNHYPVRTAAMKLLFHVMQPVARAKGMAENTLPPELDV